MHTFFNPDREGWLMKQGGRYKSWKRRWFILNDNCLYYFEYTTDKEPRGIIPLENIEVRVLYYLFLKKSFLRGWLNVLVWQIFVKMFLIDFIFILTCWTLHSQTSPYIKYMLCLTLCCIRAL